MVKALTISQQLSVIQYKCDEIKPIVVIQCLTYNHEQYIKDALDGFIAQKTDFPFVAIVHDDASTDKTAEIIRKYAEKYPNIILPIYEKENQYSKKNGNIRRVMDSAIKATGAKYIAICEGDDYWTESLKLQIQVNFLESHSEYSMCFHNVDIKHIGTQKILTYGQVIEDRDYSAEEVLYHWIIPTCSVVMRQDYVNDAPTHKDFIVGDIILWATCLSHGKIKGCSKVMGVYRRIQTGWTAQSIKSQQDRYSSRYKWIKHYKAMIECFPKLDISIFEKKIIEFAATITISDIIFFKKKFFFNFKKYYYEFGYAYILQIVRSTMRYFKSIVLRVRK